MKDAIDLLEDCIAAFRERSLTEAQLLSLSERLRESGPVQDLLYLQTATTSLESKVIGMTMLRGGEVDDGPFNHEDWPYKTAVEAISDGWRVICFPTKAHGAHSQDSHVICEFILERFGSL